MRMYDIIQKKRDGGVLSAAEIEWFIDGYVQGEIPDYQAAALCMAIYFRGMNLEETAAPTFAVRDSGERLDFADIHGLRVDKHSTGGVGDKTSLVVTPIVASLGVKVAKMSGRGLGHTGGTIDKLEAIPGFCTDLPVDKFKKIVNEVGIAIVGQNASLAPADKLLYALRDVTATVDSIPLIASSIMGKKLASGAHNIVLDVKFGSGAFMKTEDDAVMLAEKMVSIGRSLGRRVSALITDMNTPLGYAVGNTLEVAEAIEVLKDGGPSDLREVCISLASSMVSLALGIPYDEAKEKVVRSLESGLALSKFKEWMSAHGADLENTDFGRAKYSLDVKAERDGYIDLMDTELVGHAATELGAGRKKKDDKIDCAAGILLKKKTADRVRAGEVLATLYSSKEENLKPAKEIFEKSISLGDTPKEKTNLIYRII